MFNSYTLSQLKQLCREYKSYHNIKYSKLKKDELIEELEKHFVLKDGVLYKKNDVDKNRIKKAKIEQAVNTIKSTKKFKDLFKGKTKEEGNEILNKLNDERKDTLYKIYRVRGKDEQNKSKKKKLDEKLEIINNKKDYYTQLFNETFLQKNNVL